ncbi:MAG TPA: hypothetical protein VEA80_02880 [Vitreimonas sp.]|uniref:hypothetical protein n=1 Tax=Vitreimonas sp. TaxID=3069702 RepID=UPI002D56CFDE|nr:hypothetical protein [Vitreimonas sp.]HYD86397.1 hypothetical protein [Vitreimonas sp.]
MTQTAQPATRHAPLEFWRIAEWFLRTLHGLFGAPEEIAAQHTLTAKAYKLMAPWFSVGEAILRRLLLIEAAAYDAPAPRRIPRAKRPRKRRLVTFYPDDAASWRVHFRCMPAAERAVGTGAAQRPQNARASFGLQFRSAWPLALRFEAMLRVFNAPQAYAKRLARRLRGNPNAVEAVLRAPPEYAHRADRAEELTEAAKSAQQRRDSS